MDGLYGCEIADVHARKLTTALQADGDPAAVMASRMISNALIGKTPTGPFAGNA
jgi:hypothetical protein